MITSTPPSAARHRPRIRRGTVLGAVLMLVVAVLPALVVSSPSRAAGLTNPGFETINPGGVPSCWTKGGFGANTAVFDTVIPGHTGDRAGRLTVTGHADGDAKLLPALDLGTCAPGATGGTAYDLGVWYTSTADTQYDVYLRDRAGAWTYWDSSPQFGPATDWKLAGWTTGVVPEGYTGISFGLDLSSDGVLTVDDYVIAAGTATAPTTAATVAPPAPSATGWYTSTPTVALTKTGGAAGWAIQYSLDGTRWLPYTAPFPVPEGVTIVSYRSTGAGGHAEATRTLTLEVDTAEPTVTTSFDPVTRTLTATASDATPGSGGVTIETSADGGSTWTTYSTAIVVPDATTYLVRATDAAGNVSATRSISVQQRRSNATVGITVTSPRTYGRAGGARVAVTPAAGSPTPTGSAGIVVDGRSLGSVALHGGVATAPLPAGLRAGRHSVSAVYSGDAGTEPSTSPAVTLSVQKAVPAVSTKLLASRIKAGSRPKVTARVSVAGTSIRPTGRVSVRLRGRIVRRVTLRASDRGRITIRLPKVSRKGTHRVTVTFDGTSDVRSRTSRPATLRVR